MLHKTQLNKSCKPVPQTVAFSSSHSTVASLLSVCRRPGWVSARWARGSWCLGGRKAGHTPARPVLCGVTDPLRPLLPCHATGMVPSTGSCPEVGCWLRVRLGPARMPWLLLHQGAFPASPTPAPGVQPGKGSAWPHLPLSLGISYAPWGLSRLTLTNSCPCSN